MFIRLIFPSSRLPQLAASLISKQACNVVYWHETDMPKYLGDVRCWVNSVSHMLAWSFSGFDSERTLGRSVCGRLLAFLPASPSQSARFRN